MWRVLDMEHYLGSAIHSILPIKKCRHGWLEKNLDYQLLIIIIFESNTIAQLKIIRWDGISNNWLGLLSWSLYTFDIQLMCLCSHHIQMESNKAFQLWIIGNNTMQMLLHLLCNASHCPFMSDRVSISQFNRYGPYL